MARFTARARPSAAGSSDAAARGPRERKTDGGRGPGAGTPRAVDRRAASGCLWEACEALLSVGADADALERALDQLLAAFDCDGVALHAMVGGTLDPWCARGHWERAAGDLREALSVPLYRGREHVGALDLLAKKHQRWQPEQLSLVRTASGALGAALGACLELERLKSGPGNDPMTGLADARAFHHRLVDEMARAESQGAPLALIVLGIDLFTAVNDAYGPDTGDRVLAECALVLKLALREGDFVARLTGDRFGVVLPDCDLPPARRLAERLRHALEEHAFPRAGRISVSAGVAASPEGGMDPAELRIAAEQALGLAKKAGRHRTAASGPGPAH